MTTNLRWIQWLSILTAVEVLVASLWGVAVPSVYDGVIPEDLLPGVFAQDLLAVLVASTLFVLGGRLRAHAVREGVLLLGALGFCFYAYSIYSIEQVYTPLYPLYLAIMGSSFYALALGLASLSTAAIEGATLDSAVRLGAAGFAVSVALAFSVFWIGRLLPLLATGERIEYTFSIFIIDLVFIMPSFVITAVLAIRKRALGLIGLPALFVVGAAILSPLALAELFKPLRYGQATDRPGLYLYGGLSLAFALAAGVYLARLQLPSDESPRHL